MCRASKNCVNAQPGCSDIDSIYDFGRGCREPDRKNRKFEILCAVTGKRKVIFAETFNKAGDQLLDDGWTYDSFIPGYICPEARVV